MNLINIRRQTWRDSLLNIIFIIFLVAAFFYINRLTLLWADDFCRAGVHGFDSLRRAYGEYFSWSGRFFVLAQSYFIFSGNPIKLFIFDLLNSIAFSALVVLVFKTANLRNPNKKRDIADLLFITALIVCLCEAFAEIAFWKTGAINYLWGMVGELFVIYAFLSGAIKNESSRLVRWGFTLFSFYIATYLEHPSVSVSLFLIFWLLDKKITKISIPSAYKFSAAAHALGSILLIAAPGNFVRQDVWQVKAPILERVLTNFLAYKNLLINNGWALIALLLTILVFAFNRNSEGKTEDSNYSVSYRIIILFGLSFISAILLAAPGTPPSGRTSFATEVFLATALATLFGRRGESRVANYLTAGISILALAVATSFILPSTRQIYEQKKYRDYLVRSFKSGNADFFTVPSYYLDGYSSHRHPKWVFFRDFGADHNDWTNQCFVRGSIRPSGPIKIVATPSPVFLTRDIFSKYAIDKFGIESKPGVFVENGRIFYLFHSSCKTVKNKSHFFIHSIPYKLKNIHPDRRKDGYDNLDFSFEGGVKAVVVNEDGTANKDVCLIYSKVPDYKIKFISTGQYDLSSGNRYWETTIDMATQIH